jgi:hypothetical protein
MVPLQYDIYSFNYADLRFDVIDTHSAASLGPSLLHGGINVASTDFCLYCLLWNIRKVIRKGFNGMWRSDDRLIDVTAV